MWNDWASRVPRCHMPGTLSSFWTFLVPVPGAKWYTGSWSHWHWPPAQRCPGCSGKIFGPAATKNLIKQVHFQDTFGHETVIKLSSGSLVLETAHLWMFWCSGGLSWVWSLNEMDRLRFRQKDLEVKPLRAVPLINFLQSRQHQLHIDLLGKFQVPGASVRPRTPTRAFYGLLDKKCFSS